MLSLTIRGRDAVNESPTIYRLMEDHVLAAAIADLQRVLEQLRYARGPVAPALERCYRDSLDAAEREAARRAAL